MTMRGLTAPLCSRQHRALPMVAVERLGRLEAGMIGLWDDHPWSPTLTDMAVDGAAGRA